MSSIRQTELFAAEDWRVLYRAFTQVNFNASDPDSITRALREYIQANYPEDFNDWIESSEFVALIELLGWIAGTIAFKIDINARENFLETAQARESILRLARFLSYNPRRNQPARGLVKLVEVSTDDDITDASGVSLSGVRVQWDNPDDPDWFDRFTLVLNNAFTGNNPYGKPLKYGTVGGNRAQLYRVNCLMSENAPSFSARVGGEPMVFDICNGDFDDGGIFFERTPDPAAAFHLFYRNDGGGNASPRTGFFMLFKQGSLQAETVDIPAPIENRVIDIDRSGINQDDIWVQTLDQDGNIDIEWKRVPAIFSENITYNTLPVGERNIYSVITRDEDRVSLRFSDGFFGTAPVGRLRTWFRISNGRQYQIRPSEIDRISIALTYYNRRGVRRTLNLTFSLQEPVANAVSRETDEQIRRRASGVHQTQSRMVSGEDYNSFPASSNLAVKLKALVRTYSGHSRHIDLNDPTGNYQDTHVVADDGILFKMPANTYSEVPVSLNRTRDEMLALHIQPMLRSREVYHHVHDLLMERVLDAAHPYHPAVASGLLWKRSTIAKFSTTGYFTAANTHFRDGAIVEFELPDGSRKWVGIADVSGTATTPPTGNNRGPVTLAEAIPNDSIVRRIVPRFDPTLDATAIATIKANIDLNASFSLWFDPDTSLWNVRPAEALVVTTTSYGGSIKVASVEFAGKTTTSDDISNGLWRLSARGLRYVFESQRKVKWFYDGQRAIDSETGLVKSDMVRIQRANPNPLFSDGRGLGTDFDFDVEKLFLYDTGQTEPRRINVGFGDSDQDGIPDRPDAFHVVVPTDPRQRLLFWQRTETLDGLLLEKPITTVRVYEEELDRIADAPSTVGLVAYQLNSQAAERSRTFYVWNGLAWAETQNYFAAIGRGINVAAEWVEAGGNREANTASQNLLFHAKHYAPSDHRIDPSKTNNIDIFVLSSAYDFETRQWIANGSDIAKLPAAPSELDLRLSFAEFEEFKMFSDGAVWRPVKYKFLFGPGADEPLRAQFKVVKLPGAALSDGEIRSRVIRAINEFFDVSRWDFGETFYFTELSAFVHQQLAGVIGLFVIVPLSESASFGQGFEIRARSDEIFVSTAQVSDVVIINSATATNLRIR